MKILTKFLLVLALFIAIYPALLMWRVVAFSKQDQARPADAAIVLGAGVFRGRPSPILRARIDHAIQLYNTGVVDRLIFTGGIGRNDLLSEAEVSRQYALAQGISDSDILIENKSTTTIENLRFAAEIGANNELNSYLIVSTPYHMLRATWIASDIGLNATSSPTRSVRWISDTSRNRALIQETISIAWYGFRRLSSATYQTNGQRSLGENN
ncbi:MAG: uncharacterized SAM-binding protein YcdF (DUF218 family) [Cellvibrionaceae bacterium]|jgi:uncharacterized SAM-binding protein YcdF (DUF218 family)